QNCGRTRVQLIDPAGDPRTALETERVVPDGRPDPERLKDRADTGETISDRSEFFRAGGNENLAMPKLDQVLGCCGSSCHVVGQNSVDTQMGTSDDRYPTPTLVIGPQHLLGPAFLSSIDVAGAGNHNGGDILDDQIVDSGEFLLRITAEVRNRASEILVSPCTR